MDIIKSAKVTTEGLEFSGKRHLIDEMAGWVASEANHEREKKGGSRRRAKLLNSACDAIEDALR